jgi:hypothetical protein
LPSFKLIWGAFRPLEDPHVRDYWGTKEYILLTTQI